MIVKIGTTKIVCRKKIVSEFGLHDISDDEESDFVCDLCFGVSDEELDILCAESDDE